MKSLAYVFVALFPALFTYGSVKERLNASELARDGLKVAGTIESVQVRKSVTFPDFFYLYYTYFPPGGGSVLGKVRVSKSTAESVRVGMPVDVRMHPLYKDRHATIPYHLDMARDWTWPIAYGFLTLCFLYGAWVNRHPARLPDA